MNPAASLALLPFSALYGAVMRVRQGLYQTGLFARQHLQAPVVSVGNLTTGGTGKTPLVEWTTRYLAQTGHRPCVLTRGYARANKADRIVVADGTAILADVNQAGDEALWLAEQLRGQAAVVADRDRVAAGQWAIDNLQSDCFVLDDGFQNLRLTRNLNIVTIDATSPWGNGRLLPAGRLREPRRELRRADCIVITRADRSTSLEGLKNEIAYLSHDRPVFLSRMKTRSLRHLANSRPPLPDKQTGPMAAFCGVGNPASFFAQLRADNHDLSYVRSFADHHKYTQGDIDAVVGAARESEAQGLLTTAKDEVKLRRFHFDLPCYAVDIQIEIDEAARLGELISRAVQGN
jgi:tetraacyldisaccharide 4'-kinase